MNFYHDMYDPYCVTVFQVSYVFFKKDLGFLCVFRKRSNSVQCLWCIGDRDVLCYLLVDKQCQSSRDKELKREARYIEAACNELRREKHSCRQIRNHSFQLTQSLLELKSKNLEIQQNIEEDVSSHDLMLFLRKTCSYGLSGSQARQNMVVKTFQQTKKICAR